MKPTVDEVFDYFMKSASENLHNQSAKTFLSLLKNYIAKIKDNIYGLIWTDSDWKLILDINSDKLDTLMIEFVNKQNFIAKNIIKPVMKMNRADNLDNFIKSMHDGHNSRNNVIEWLTALLNWVFIDLSSEYQIWENKESIKEKLDMLFL